MCQRGYQRGRERLDVRTGMHDDSLGDALLHGESAPWMPFVRRVSGEAAHECFRGVMDSRPGSVAQEWHSDGHEWDEALEGGELPTEARRLTLFIPLVDLGNPRCGATQTSPALNSSPSTTLRRRPRCQPGVVYANTKSRQYHCVRLPDRPPRWSQHAAAGRGDTPDDAHRIRTYGV